MSKQWENLRYWFHDYWKVLLFVAGLVVFFIGLGLWATRYDDLPVLDEEGVIEHFGAYDSKYGARPVVLVRMADGRVIQLGVPGWATQNCHVGSRIHLTRQGRILRVSRRGCALHKP